MSQDKMTFNWKMKPSHKLTLTMFSPDTFQGSTKPQKTTTTTTVVPVKLDCSNHLSSDPSVQPNSSSGWCFHSEFPDHRKQTKDSEPPRNSEPRKIPPLERMTSAPGDLEKYTLQRDSSNILAMHQNSNSTSTSNSNPSSNSHQPIPSSPSPPPPNIVQPGTPGSARMRTQYRSGGGSANHYQPYPSSTTNTPRSRSRASGRSGFVPHPFHHQDSAPSLLQTTGAASPNIQLMVPPLTQAPRPTPSRVPPPLNKLSSAPNLFDYLNSNQPPPQPQPQSQLPQGRNSVSPRGRKKIFRPPPLISYNSENSLIGNTLRPLTSPTVRGSGPGGIYLPPLKEISSPGLLEKNRQSADWSAASPIHSDSDQEMAEVERQTGKMSIQNLLG